MGRNSLFRDIGIDAPLQSRDFFFLNRADCRFSSGLGLCAWSAELVRLSLRTGPSDLISREAREAVRLAFLNTL